MKNQWYYVGPKCFCSFEFVVSNTVAHPDRRNGTLASRPEPSTELKKWLYSELGIYRYVRFCENEIYSVLGYLQCDAISKTVGKRTWKHDI